MNNANLKNRYEEIEKSESLRKGVLSKKLEQHARSAREQVQKLMLGDDGKVGEAVIMSFFASLYGSVFEGFRAYKEARLKNEMDNVDKNLERTRGNIKTIKEAEEKTRQINEFTRLNIQKAALEHKLNDETLTKSERLEAEKGLRGIVSKIDKIADFYEKTADVFGAEVEKAESGWLGKSAELMKELRILSPEIRETLLKNVSVAELIENNTLVDNLIKAVSNSIIDNDLAETLADLGERAIKSATQETLD